jgi:phenylacetate-CoA ligase
MVIVKGVNIFPVQVERVLMDIPEVGTNYRIVLEQVNGLDTMRVQVEVHSQIFKEDMRYLRGLQEKIAHDLHNELLITPKVELVEPNSLPQSEGKAVRVIDTRPRTPGAQPASS